MHLMLDTCTFSFLSVSITTMEKW